jgi:hypothetical protein
LYIAVEKNCNYYEKQKEDSTKYKEAMLLGLSSPKIILKTPLFETNKRE